MGTNITADGLGFGGSTNRLPKHERKVAGLARITQFFQDLKRAGSAAALYRELSAMSDSELAERGLTRADLTRIAYEESFGRLTSVG